MTETVDGRRRRLLAALLGVPTATVILSACSADPSPKAAPGSRRDVDVDVKVRWNAVSGEQALLALHAATVAAHPSLADRLAALTAHHDEHLAALRADGPLPFGAGDAAAPAAEVPADPAAALAAVVEAERAAGDSRLADCLAAGGPRLAAVLASIAGSEAAHGAVLAG